LEDTDGVDPDVRFWFVSEDAAGSSGACVTMDHAAAAMISASELGSRQGGARRRYATRKAGRQTDVFLPMDRNADAEANAVQVAEARRAAHEVGWAWVRGNLPDDPLGLFGAGFATRADRVPRGLLSKYRRCAGLVFDRICSQEEDKALDGWRLLWVFDAALAAPVPEGRRVNRTLDARFQTFLAGGWPGLIQGVVVPRRLADT
jgi:hypothetical protein